MRMSKYVLSMLLIAAFLVVASGSSYAASSLSAGNTSLAAEKISPTANYTASKVNTAYEPAAAVATSSVLTVSLSSGATFTDGSTVAICLPGSATVYGSGTVGASPNDTSVNITIAVPLASGTTYVFEDTNCAGATTVPTTPLTNVVIPAGTVAGTQFTMTVLNTNTSDTVTAPLILVENQFNATLTPVTTSLTFSPLQLEYVPSPLGSVPPNTPTPVDSQALLVVTSNQAINDKVLVTTNVNACESSLADLDALVFAESGNLAGFSAVNGYGYGLAQANAAPNEGAPYFGVGVTAGDVTAGVITVDQENAAICLSTDSIPAQGPVLDLTASTTTAIAVGSRTLELTFKAAGGASGSGAGYKRDLIAAGTTSHTFQLTATQYYIPVVVTGNGTETYIMLNSATNISGANGVAATVGGACPPCTYTASLGTITPGTPFMITGSQLAAIATGQGGSVDSSVGFGAIITVNTPVKDTWEYANICSPTGCKDLPVKTLTAAGNVQ